MSESLKTESVQDRLDRIQELTEFTEKCRKRLNDIFDTLGWSWNYEDANKEPLEQCPYDPNHRVPAGSLDKHKLSCRLRKMGYSAEEQAEMVDTSSCYQNTVVRSFTMDRSTQQQVILQARSAAPMMKMEGVFWQGQYSSQPGEVPQNHKRTVCDLSVADRLALYDHVIGVLNEHRDAPESSGQDDLYVDWVSKLQKGEEQNEPKTHLELMAEMRDYKRRRQSYRAKNVHITKKSYTEVIREVINVHSEELGRQWREEEPEEEEETRSKVSSHRRPSSSSESPHSHSKRQRSREQSHDRESKKRRRRKERDSRSPEDRHRDRKKKKKKKSRKEEKKEKEEKEKEEKDKEK